MKMFWFLVLLVFAESCFAFRCGSRLVDVGDTRYEVQSICGLPDDVTSTVAYRSITNGSVVDCESVPVRSVSSLSRSREDDRETAPSRCLALVEDRLAVEVGIDVWLYDFGKNRFMRRVTFENGIVTRIEKLGYGLKPRR